MEKDFAIVRFIETDDYTEIPKIWLLNTNELKGKIMCKWPPPIVKNTNRYIKNKCLPEEDWPIYEVEILRYCDSLEKARNAAEYADYTSSEENVLDHGRRQNKRTSASVVSENKDVYKRIKTISESSDEDIYQETKLPALHNLPEFQSYHNETPNMNEEDEDYDSPFTVITTSANDQEVDNMNSHDNRLKRAEDKIDTAINLLGKILVEIKDLKQRVMALDGVSNRYSCGRKVPNKIKQYLPLANKEAIAQFENFLTLSEENHRGFVQIIHQVGGRNGEEFTKRVLELIFSHSFAKENTWEGRKTKYSVKSLSLIAIIQEIILQKFPNWSSSEFEKTSLNWFRLGNQRSGNQPGQLEKKKNAEVNSNSCIK